MKQFITLILCTFPCFFLVSSEFDEDQDENRGLQVLEFNSALQEAMGKEAYWAVIDYANLIEKHFSESPFAEDAEFMIGDAYYKLGQLELANQHFDTYLKNVTSPKYFEQAIEYKFSIAEKFRLGAKKPLFGSHKLPKWMPAKEDALEIYEDVITAFPHHDIALKSLLGKAELQIEFQEYEEAVKTLDVLLRKFPKHNLAPKAYLEKGHVYLKQCSGKNLDPSLLDAASLNLTKFKLAFPREAKVKDAEAALAEMQERFAGNLLEIGNFFERTKKHTAASIYYKAVTMKYPQTKAASDARSRLALSSSSS